MRGVVPTMSLHTFYPVGCMRSTGSETDNVIIWLEKCNAREIRGIQHRLGDD